MQLKNLVYVGGLALATLISAEDVAEECGPRCQAAKIKEANKVAKAAARAAAQATRDAEREAAAIAKAAKVAEKQAASEARWDRRNKVNADKTGDRDDLAALQAARDAANEQAREDQAAESAALKEAKNAADLAKEIKQGERRDRQQAIANSKAIARQEKEDTRVARAAAIQVFLDQRADQDAAREQDRAALKQKRGEEENLWAQRREAAKLDKINGVLKWDKMNTDDWCVPGAVSFADSTRENGITRGTLSVSQPASAPNAAGWYVLADVPKRNSVSSVTSDKEVSVDTRSAVLFSGFGSWCQENEDGYIELEGVTFESSGDRDPANWSFFYCYAEVAPESDEVCEW